MTDFDFNEAEPQRAGGGDLIPDGTVALLIAKIRPGGQGQDGWLKGSSTGCEMLDLEFTVDGGDFDRRKLWSNYVVSGVTEGHEKAANITRSRLRAMLESARGITPDDSTPAAMEARKATGYGDFDGIPFTAVIGVEQGALKDKTAGPNSERYADKNIIKSVITPDKDGWIKPAGAKPVASKPQAPAANSNPATKPSWAA